MVSLADGPKAGSVIEPGCGSGVFLQALREAGYRSVTGYEIDRQAVRACQQEIPDVEVIAEDFLLQPRDPRHHLAIGNPPYVAWNRIAGASKKLLTGDPFWQPLINGEWDLAYAFIVQAAEMLLPDGQLIFVVPSSWMSTTYAESLRRYLAENGRLREMIFFNDYRLFPDAAPEALVFRWQKGKRSGPLIAVAELENTDQPLNEVIRDLAQALKCPGRERQRSGPWSSYLSEPMPTEGRWSVAPKAEAQRVETIERACDRKRVRDVLRVAVGAVSGLEPAFRLGPEEAKELNAEERKLVRRLVKGKECQRWARPGGRPYIWTNRLGSAAEFRRRAPRLYRRLLRYRPELEARYEQRRWWQWATIRNLEAMEQPGGRLFVRIIDRYPRPQFAFSSRKVLGSGDVLSLLPRAELSEDLRYAWAWLNSDAVADWFRIRGFRTGGRSRYTQSGVEEIPYRAIDWNKSEEIEAHREIVSIVSQKKIGPEDENRLEEIWQGLLAEKKTN